MSDIELKPCPFCGGSDLENSFDYERHCFQVRCLCGAEMRGIRGNMKDCATEWNTRQPDPAPLVEALEWYERKVRDCRKITSEGDTARAILDSDGGSRAAETLAKYRGEK